MCTTLIYSCILLQNVEVNVSKTYLPFFLTYPSICIRENIKARVGSLLGSMWTNFGTLKYAIIKHIHYKVRQLRWEPKKRTKKVAKVSR